MSRYNSIASPHASQTQRINAQVSQNSSSPLHDGSLVRGRVLSSDGAGSYTVSIAGRQVVVRSTLPLAAGQAFTAQIQLNGNEIRLVLQNAAAREPLVSGAQNMQALLTALGLPAGAESERLVAFVQVLGIKLQPEALKKALASSRALGGRNDAAFLSVLLDDKGMESGADAVQAVFDGGAGGERHGSGGHAGSSGENAGQDAGKDNSAASHVASDASFVYDAITSTPAAFFADYAAQADYAAEHASSDESRAGALTACNQLYRKREAEDANLHWIFLPFDWDYNGYSGVIRVLFDAARKKIVRLAVNMQNNMVQNKFLVYYNLKGIERAEFCCTPPCGIEKRVALESSFAGALKACTGKSVSVAYNEEL